MIDIVLNKKESIKKCIKQIDLYYSSKSKKPFEKDFMKQDAIAINLQRACELCIDLSNHVIKTKKLDISLMKDVIENKLDDLLEFTNHILHFISKN